MNRRTLYQLGIFTAVLGAFIASFWFVKADPLNLWQDNGSAIYYSGGEVGIGTASTFGYRQLIVGSANPGISLYNSSDAYRWSFGVNELTTNDNRFYLYDDIQGRSAISMAPTTDYVGLGTSTPGYELTVGGDINFTGNLYKNGVLFSSGSGSTTTSTVTSINDLCPGGSAGQILESNGSGGCMWVNQSTNPLYSSSTPLYIKNFDSDLFNGFLLFTISAGFLILIFKFKR